MSHLAQIEQKMEEWGVWAPESWFRQKLSSSAPIPYNWHHVGHALFLNVDQLPTHWSLEDCLPLMAKLAEYLRWVETYYKDKPKGVVTPKPPSHPTIILKRQKKLPYNATISDVDDSDSPPIRNKEKSVKHKETEKIEDAEEKEEAKEEKI